MRRRQIAVMLAGAVVVAVVTFALLRFLAPGLAYRLEDRLREELSGASNRTYRIALGVRAGSYYHLGTVLNRYLEERAGYTLELVATGGVPENVGALLDPARGIHLAMVESSSDEAAMARSLYGLAAIGRQFFFVAVRNDSGAKEFRDLTGGVNPGIRSEGQAPTLGERVLAYYGLIAPPAVPAARPTAWIVRPREGILSDFETGHTDAVTRTQFLHADLIEDVLATGQYRLVPIADHEALAAAIPGTQPAFIPAGTYGPARRIPAEPVPTLAVTTLLVARADLPGRVVRDILDVVYDPRFARDIGYPMTEESGRIVGDLPLHRAADVFYHRNDLPTSELVGRLSFIGTLVAGIFAAVQFFGHVRQREQLRVRRRLLVSDAERLDSIRRRIAGDADDAEARQGMTEADDLLSHAEQAFAAGLLDAEGVAAIRSLHRMTLRAFAARPSAPRSHREPVSGQMSAAIASPPPPQP